MRYNRHGFTLMELVVVIVILGFVALLAIRPMRETQQSSRVRAARVIGATYVVLARTTAITRGCRATIHFTQSDTTKAWITTCRLTAVGSVTNLVDTVGTVDKMGDRLGVSLASTADSIVFDAQGIATGAATSRFKYTKGSPVSIDSFVVSPLGMVVQ